MATATLNLSTVINGTSYIYNRTTAAYDLVSTFPTNSIAAAKTGALTTRTDDNTGVLTMDSGHGITTGARLDVYWVLNGLNYCRRGMTVGTVSGDTVPIDLGAGDVLPADESDITAMVPILQTLSLDTANFIVWGAKTSTLYGFTVSIGTTSGSYTEGASFMLNGADGEWAQNAISASTYLQADPLVAASAFNTVYVSHGDSSGAVTFNFDIGSV